MASLTKFPRHIDDGLQPAGGGEVRTTVSLRDKVEMELVDRNDARGYVLLAPDEARALATDLLIRADEAERKRA